MTLRELAVAYGSLDDAARVIVAGGYQPTADEWGHWPEWFRSYVTFLQVRTQEVRS